MNFKSATRSLPFGQTDPISGGKPPVVCQIYGVIVLHVHKPNFSFYKLHLFSSSCRNGRCSRPVSCRSDTAAAGLCTPDNISHPVMYGKKNQMHTFCRIKQNGNT